MFRPLLGGGGGGRVDVETSGQGGGGGRCSDLCPEGGEGVDVQTCALW